MICAGYTNQKKKVWGNKPFLFDRFFGIISTCNSAPAGALYAQRLSKFYVRYYLGGNLKWQVYLFVTFTRSTPAA
jgi:hypothetical protein